MSKNNLFNNVNNINEIIVQPISNNNVNSIDICKVKIVETEPDYRKPQKRGEIIIINNPININNYYPFTI